MLFHNGITRTAPSPCNLASYPDSRAPPAPCRCPEPVDGSTTTPRVHLSCCAIRRCSPECGLQRRAQNSRARAVELVGNSEATPCAHPYCRVPCRGRSTLWLRQPALLLP